MQAPTTARPSSKHIASQRAKMGYGAKGDVEQGNTARAGPVVEGPTTCDKIKEAILAMQSFFEKVWPRRPPSHPRPAFLSVPQHLRTQPHST